MPLNQGLALIPASGPWLREVTGPGGEQCPYPVFEFLGRSLAGFLREASVRGPVAYLEIEEMQDRTFEAAVAWSGGELALPPQVLQPGEALPPALWRRRSAASALPASPAGMSGHASGFTGSATRRSGWRFPG